MQKLYEIFKILHIQKRIVSAETIGGNTVIFLKSSKILDITFQFSVIIIFKRLTMYNFATHSYKSTTTKGSFLVRVLLI